METFVVVRTSSTGAQCRASVPIALPAAQAHGQHIAQTTRHLIARGHRRILLITVAESDLAWADAELQGHGAVMLAADLPLLPRLELAGAAGLWTELASALETLAPTALLCTRAALVPRLEAALEGHERRCRLTITGADHGEWTQDATCH